MSAGLRTRPVSGLRAGLVPAVRSLWIAAWAALLVQLPSVARACSVCTAGRDEENQLAFLLSTIFMSALPLLALGTLVFVLWRRMRKLEDELREGQARPDEA